MLLNLVLEKFLETGPYDMGIYRDSIHYANSSCYTIYGRNGPGRSVAHGNVVYCEVHHHRVDVLNETIF